MEARSLEVSQMDMIKNNMDGLDGVGQRPVANTINFALLGIEADFAVFEGAPERSIYNPIGSLHA
jgi:hypothetical protein